MAQHEWLTRLRSYLADGRFVTREALLAEFNVSLATLKRDVAYLRDRLNCPLIFDRDRRGYRLDPVAQLQGTQYELPGLWLSSVEIHALLTMQHLLANLDSGGLLRPHIAPLMPRLTRPLDNETHDAAVLAKRIRVQTVGARPLQLPRFQLRHGLAKVTP